MSLVDMSNCGPEILGDGSADWDRLDELMDGMGDREVIRLDDRFSEGLVVGYEDICGAAYTGCPLARNENIFETICVRNARAYAHKGVCSCIANETERQLAPMLMEDVE